MAVHQSSLRSQLRRVPGVVPAHRLYRARTEVLDFQRGRMCDATFADRARLVGSFMRVTHAVACEHSEGEMLTIASAILRSAEEPGVVVEAGCYKGGSTAKLSKVVAKVGKQYYVFDSFEGIPFNDELHDKNIWGGPAGFNVGDYSGSLEEVCSNVAKYGDVSCCTFVKGWFSETLGSFNEPIAVAYLDVDLVSSTRECLEAFYPLLIEGGVIFSQDGHLPLVVDLLRDQMFWEGLRGCPAPIIDGLGTRKLVAIRKPEVGASRTDRDR